MQKYEKPLCEVVVFENLDIIRTSDDGDGLVNKGDITGDYFN